MFGSILSSFGVGAIHRLAMITGFTSNIIRTFEQEFANDQNAKNAAIDSIIDLLKSHKDLKQDESPKEPTV